MALSASGIGSGLDVEGIIGQLMQLERRPLQKLAQREQSHEASLSAFGKVQGTLSSLQSAADGLNDAAKFAATKATVGNNAGFTASSDTEATEGNYSIRVDQLAQTQRVATQAGNGGFEPGAGEGTLTLNFGNLSNGEFTADPQRSATLEFAGGSLQDLRDAINGDATLGVTASIIFNGEEDQLVLRGTDTGADAAFSLSGTGSLDALQYNPADANDPTSGVYGLQQAQNALLNIDGIDISRGSNTVDDAIDGVTLELTETTEQAASLGVAQDTSAARAAVQKFVNAYNETASTLQELTRYNPETGNAGVLNGDSTVRGIQTQMRSMLGGAFGGLGDLSMLSQVGIGFERDGKLSLDNTRLAEALDNPDMDVATFFAGTDDQPGVAAQLSERLDGYIRSGGLIDGRTDGINSSIDRIDSQRENLMRRLERTEERYRAQYSALDSMIAQMNQTSDYLTQQLANLPGNRRR